MPRPAPVDRDEQLLDFIVRFIDGRGYSPTYREMAAQFDVTIKTVRDSLRRLRAGGRLTWNEGQTRTLRITTPAQEGTV